MMVLRIYLMFAISVCLLSLTSGIIGTVINFGEHSLADPIYLTLIPLGWLTSILDTRKTIQTQSAKGRSLVAYVLALSLLTNTLIRAIIIQDFLFSLNAFTFLLLNSFQLCIFIKYRST